MNHRAIKKEQKMVRRAVQMAKVIKTRHMEPSDREEFLFKQAMNERAEAATMKLPPGQILVPEDLKICHPEPLNGPLTVEWFRDAQKRLEQSR